MRVAMYLRLSSEDGDLKDTGKAESESISNQRGLLQSFISSRPEFIGWEISEFCDDGWSGKNFERPDFLRMMEQVKQGQAAARELTQVIRYLTEHQKQFSVNMDDYAIFGFSAGGLMTTAYSFANYEDCCHKNHLPRPKVIFPMYGLDWNIKALQEDKGLAVFSIVGRDDEFGFANVEDKLPELEKVLGKENVSVRIVDGLGHGFGIGNETKVKNWIQEAVIFWEAHR